MEKEKFDLGKLSSSYLAERSGAVLDSDMEDRLDLWCEDVSTAMLPDPSDSVAMAKRATSLWRELGMIWPADGNDGIRAAHRDMLQAVMERKGFTVGGKQFEEGFAMAMDGAADPNGYRNLYKLVAGGISGDGVTRDGYGRQLHENGRPESMRYLPPGGYASAMKRDNERIRTGLELDGWPVRGPAETKPAPEAPKEDAKKKPGAWDRLKAMLGGEPDGDRDFPDTGPEF